MSTAISPFLLLRCTWPFSFSFIHQHKMDEISKPRRVTRAYAAAMETKNEPVLLNTISYDPAPLKSKSGKRKKIWNEVKDEEQSSGEKKIVYYVLNRPIEAPHMQVYTNHNVIRDLKQKLSQAQFNKFKDTCFGVYTRMHQCSVQAQIFRCFMACELIESSPDTLLIHINHSTLRFSIREFAIISGLNCVADPEDFSFNRIEPNRLIQQYFGGKRTVKKAELVRGFRNKIWGDENDDDAVKLAILYFINTFIFSRENTNASIPRIHFDLVESGRYNEYPWGIKVFKALVNSISKKMDAVKQYYRIGGMPLAMQVWLYECCSSVDSKIAIKELSRIPRLLNWRTIDKRPHYEYLMEGMFGDNNNPSTYRNISPTLKEIAFLKIPPEKDAGDIICSKIAVDEPVDDDIFTSVPPVQLLKKKKRKKKADGSLLPPKKKKRQHTGAYLGEKSSIESPVVSTKANNNVPQNFEKQPKVSIGDDVADEIIPSTVLNEKQSSSNANDIVKLREDLAKLKDSVSAELKELRLLITENFKILMDAINVKRTNEDAFQEPLSVISAPNEANEGEINHHDQHGQRF